MLRARSAVELFVAVSECSPASSASFSVTVSAQAVTVSVPVALTAPVSVRPNGAGNETERIGAVTEPDSFTMVDLRSSKPGAQSYAFQLPDGAAGVGTIGFKVVTDAGHSLPEYDALGNASFANNTSRHVELYYAVPLVGAVLHMVER